MDQAQLNWITNFIWGIADDTLRDVFVRGKYRDVILPMTVLRRLDAVLEPTVDAVREMKAALDREQITNQDDALRSAAGQAFYNTSPFLLRDLKSRKTQQTLKDDFMAYLDGFSPNVQDILKNFEFRNQIPRLSESDGLGQLIEKFLDKDINLSPDSVGDLPGLDNHSMGTVFEDLVRMFNEDNNEEAGQHWTPRDAVKLMASLMFLPVADKIESGTYLLYDCACGTGGMLTVAEETLQQIATAHGKQVATHLYGQEINAETYAICKADLLLKGDGDAADNIVGGPAFSTLSNDQFRSRSFDFMLANPPYGKSWKSDLERMSGDGGKKGVKDPRFLIEHGGEGAPRIVEFEPDPDLRDYEQIPFMEAPPSGLPGGLPSEASAKEGIEAFLRREVLPYTPDAWLVEADIKIGYEVSFTRHFYQPPQLRALAQISADILALEQETEGLLHEITKGATA